MKVAGVFVSPEAMPPIPSHTEQFDAQDAPGQAAEYWSQRRSRPQAWGLPSHTAWATAGRSARRRSWSILRSEFGRVWGMREGKER